MSKLFKKAGEVQLINGGYLSDAENNPVTNEAFVSAQLRADRLVKIAAAMKGKNFEATTPDSIASIVADVDAALNATVVTEFVKVPEVKAGKITTALKDEALAFIGNTEKADFAEKVNGKMQEFTTIQEFEEFGLFFKNGVVKLNQIYTIKEITAAAKAVYAVLD